MDDFGGAEASREKAVESYEAMGKLLRDVGIEESEEKAEGEVAGLVGSLNVSQGPYRR